MSKIQVKCLNLLDDGHSIAERLENPSKYPKIFLEGLLPEETGWAEIIEEKKNITLAKLIEISTFSPKRIKPECQHYEICGGCNLQHLSYSGQLEYKQNKVMSQLNRIAKIHEDVTLNITPSPVSFGYRNKIRLQIQWQNEHYEIGYHQKASNTLVNIITCPVFQFDITELISTLKSEMNKHCQQDNNYLELSIHFSEKTNSIHLHFLTQALSNELNQIVPVLVKKYPKLSITNSTVKKQTFQLIHGEPYITQSIKDTSLKIHPLAFFQANVNITEIIIEKLLPHIPKGVNILELYSGVGTFTLPLSSLASHIDAVEMSPHAHKTAIINIQENHRHHIKNHMKDACKQIINEAHQLLFVDPPRTGLHQDTIKQLNKKKLQTIVYLSCDSGTLARDISLLKENYSIQFIEALDMFPMTTHVETLCILTLNQ